VLPVLVMCTVCVCKYCTKCVYILACYKLVLTMSALKFDEEAHAEDMAARGE
jgi:hypothetical protein